MRIYEIYYGGDEPESEFYATRKEADAQVRLSGGVAVVFVYHLQPTRKGIVGLLNTLEDNHLAAPCAKL